MMKVLYLTESVLNPYLGPTSIKQYQQVPSNEDKASSSKKQQMTSDGFKLTFDKHSTHYVKQTKKSSIIMRWIYHLAALGRFKGRYYFHQKSCEQLPGI